MHHIIKLWERVNVMTIADAIKKVLEKYPEGLTDKAIYEKIIENGYYEFGAQEPIKVVAVELKRHCEGQTISNASSNKCFVVELNENKKLYKLKYVRGQVMGETKKYACSTAVINGVAIYTFTMTVQDAPFSNADEKHIANISKVLPKVAEQVILVVMNKDWEYAQSNMIDRLGMVYQIEKASEIKSTIRRNNASASCSVLNAPKLTRIVPIYSFEPIKS